MGIGDKIATVVFEKIITPIPENLSKLWGQFQSDFGLAYEAYLERAYEKYSRIKTLLNRAEPRVLKDIFVVPHLEKKPENPIEADNVNKLLAVSSTLIIAGIGGTGKSTLMKYLFLNALENEAHIPILIELRSINAYSEEYKFEDLVFKRLNLLGSTLNPECLDYALQSGCFLFLLDGYDEISSAKLRTFFDKINDFVDRYPQNSYLISSRPFTNFVELQRFTVLEICPLSLKKAVLLVEKTNFDAEIKDRFIQALQSGPNGEGLYESHQSFASNPLLLGIMLLTYDDYAEIPEKIHIFYDKAFETLYSRHEATKGGKREWKSNLPPDSFKKVFSCFCFISYARGMFAFSPSELREVLKRTPKLLSDIPPFDIEAYISDLIKEICLLYEDGLERYVFVHRSFQEYFAALFLKELPDDSMRKLGIGLIQQDVHRSIVDSVFWLLYEIAKERFERNILLPILLKLEKDLGDCDKYDFYFDKFDIRKREDGSFLAMDLFDFVFWFVSISFRARVQGPRIGAMPIVVWKSACAAIAAELSDDLKRKQSQTEMDLSEILYL